MLKLVEDRPLLSEIIKNDSTEYPNPNWLLEAKEHIINWIIETIKEIENKIFFKIILLIFICLYKVFLRKLFYIGLFI